MSETRLSIDTVLRNPKNWPDGINFDAIDGNHKLLESYMKNMYFSEIPMSPANFVFLFSVEAFGFAFSQILSSLPEEPQTIWFKEYDKIALALKLNEIGVGFVYDCDKGLIAIRPQDKEVYVDIAF